MSDEYTSGLLGAAVKLIKGIKTGNFDDAVNVPDLSVEEGRAVMMLAKAMKKDYSAVTYDLMKYKLTSDALGVALWDMDVINGDPVNPDNKFIWSQEFRQMLGFTDKNDFPNILSSWSDRLHPEDKERTLNAFEAHITDCSGKTPYNIEYRLMMKDGTYRDFHAFGTTLRDKAGTPLKVAGALDDITEKKKMQSELKTNDMVIESMSNMLNGINAMICVTDIDSNEILFINDFMKEHYGVKDSTGKLCYKVFQADQNERCDFCPCHQLDKNPDMTVEWEEYSTFTKRYYRKTNRYIDWLDGKKVHIQHSVDITDLIQAEEQAKTANLAKSNFLSNMSHEIRTPMNAIIGMTAIGKSAHDVEKKNYAFEKIDAASSHLLGVINDILDMSKIEANKFELSYVDFDFEKMLHKVMDIVFLRADEKKQTLKVNLDPKIPQKLIGDDLRLIQVLTNLLSNAVKFTPEHGVISLNTHLLDTNDNKYTIQVEVVDTGIGIDKEKQAKLFESFEQAENDTTRKFGGTGLGLSISKHIIEKMDGRLWVESRLGEGATFAFTLCLERGSDDGVVTLLPSINKENVKLLVVDDDPETLAYFTSFTDMIGIKCDTASSGKTALDMIQQGNKYNICFIDWKMSEINGMELSRKIKSITENDTIIIMISAYDRSAIEQEAKTIGIDGFLTKPLFPSSLIDNLNNHLGIIVMSDENIGPGHMGLFSGYHILLAEDVEVNREIVHALLEPTRVKITDAENGKEAVRMFSETPDKYDIIFMDIQMPEMDGYEASRQIRALDVQKAKTIPIVAMTANVFREDVERCLAVGMNDHVGKPINMGDVMEKMRIYLR